MNNEHADRNSRAKRTTVALVAGAAGLVLLTGGTTFALWSQSSTVPGGSISSGSLGVVSSGGLAWADTSADVTDGPVAIPDLSSFAIVPGDTILAAQPLTLSLTGNDIEANLSAVMPAGGALTGALADDGLSGTVYLVPGTVDPTAGTFDPASAYASAPLDGSDDSGATFAFHGAISGATKNVTAVVELTFASTQVVGVGEQAALDGLSVQLTQVRPNNLD